MSGVSYSRFIAQYNSIQSYCNSTQSYAGKDISWFKFIQRYYFSSQILWIRFLNCWSLFWELEQIGQIFKDAQHVCALGKLQWDCDRQKLCGAEVFFSKRTWL